MIRWDVELGRVDILYKVSMMSQHFALLHIDHIKQVYHIFGFMNTEEKNVIIWFQLTSDQPKFSITIPKQLYIPLILTFQIKESIPWKYRYLLMWNWKGEIIIGTAKLRFSRFVISNKSIGIVRNMPHLSPVYSVMNYVIYA